MRRPDVKEQRVHTSERVDTMLAEIDETLAGLYLVFILCELFGGSRKEG